MHAIIIASQKHLIDAVFNSVQGGISGAEAIQAIGLGTWRLNGAMDPAFEALAAQVEGMWRQLLEGNLGLYPLPKVRSE